ncbi:hypothetical protein RhiirB3_405216, partial [Rhizophagus irregularis]
MRSMDRRYWCRTRSSILFLGCPLDFELVDLSVLKNKPPLSEESKDDDDYSEYDEDYDKKFEWLEEYIKKNYGTLFYLGQAIVGPDLSEWSDRNEVYLAIHLPYDEDEEDEQLKIPDLKNFFTNFDLNVLDQFRDLMKLLGQPENDSEPGLCSCQSNI